MQDSYRDRGDHKVKKPPGKSFSLDNKGGGKGNRVPPPFPVQGVQPQPSDGSLAAMGYKNKAATKA